MKKIINKENVFILAEVAQSYEGNIDVLVDTSEKTCQAGADGIMFQVVFADELAVKDYVHYNLFKSLEMPQKNWQRVIQSIQHKKKLAFGEVFGKRSVDMMMNLGIDALKIHASDLSNLPFLKYVGTLKVPVLLSVGGGYDAEIKTAIRVLEDGGVEELILMHGYQACPTDIRDTHLAKMQALQNIYGLPVGYSDHIAGCHDGNVKHLNELALYLPLVAIGAGAKVIEKHIMRDRAKAWEDHESALIPEEFSTFVKLIRALESSLGEKNTKFYAPETAYRQNAKKYLVAAHKIQKGTKLKEGMVAFKRIANPSTGLTNLEEAVGKIAAWDLDTDDPIQSSGLTDQ